MEIIDHVNISYYLTYPSLVVLIEFFIHHRLVVIINYCPLYGITVSKFIQKL